MIIYNPSEEGQAFEWSSGFSKLCWINRACAFDISRHEPVARNSIPLYHTLRKNRLDQKLNKNHSLILPKKDTNLWKTVLF